MQVFATIETHGTDLQLTDADKLRIGVAWEALAANSRRTYQLAWRQLDGWLSEKGYTIDTLTDAIMAGYLSAWIHTASHRTRCR